MQALKKFQPKVGQRLITPITFRKYLFKTFKLKLVSLQLEKKIKKTPQQSFDALLSI
jgi:hypothetical protein